MFSAFLQSDRCSLYTRPRCRPSIFLHDPRRRLNGLEALCPRIQPFATQSNGGVAELTMPQPLVCARAVNQIDANTEICRRLFWREPRRVRIRTFTSTMAGPGHSDFHLRFAFPLLPF